MDATDRQRDAEGGEGRGGGGGGGGIGEGGGEVTHIKSNNPHLTGGESNVGKLMYHTWMVWGDSPSKSTP